MDKLEKLTMLVAWLGEPLKTLEPVVGACLLSPEKALAGIPDLPEDPGDLQNHWSFQFFYFLAYGQLALDRNAGSESDIRQLCEKSLLAFRRARDLAVGLLDLDVEPIAAHLDDVAIILEKCVPGRVQELLGETKLKYLLFADRASIANAIRERLSREELREICELPLKLPFTFRSALFGAVNNVGDRQMLHIMLYEQNEIWGPGDEQNPIKGQLVLSRSYKAGSPWTVDRVS